MSLFLSNLFLKSSFFWFQKKVLQQLKSPKPEPTIVQPIKRIPENASDAKEVAKKLLKSGKIQAIKAPDNIRQDSGFKRSKSHERKRCTGTDKPGGYLPFHNTSHSIDEEPNCIIVYQNQLLAKSVVLQIATVMMPNQEKSLFMKVLECQGIHIRWLVRKHSERKSVMERPIM